MDTSHVALVSLNLSMEGFEEYRCDQTQKLGYSQVKIIEGGIDAYIEFQPLTKEDKIKVRMVAQAGNDLSMLVSGVDTRQAGQKLY